MSRVEPFFVNIKMLDINRNYSPKNTHFLLILTFPFICAWREGFLSRSLISLPHHSTRKYKFRHEPFWNIVIKHACIRIRHNLPTPPNAATEKAKPEQWWRTENQSLRDLNLDLPLWTIHPRGSPKTTTSRCAPAPPQTWWVNDADDQKPTVAPPSN